MPDPPFDTRQESMKFVGASSFEGDPIYFTAEGGAPSRHGGSPSRYASDSDDSGKAIVVGGDTDVSGVTGKELMNVASSYEGDPTCFSPNETRPLPGGGSPLRYASDSDDSGKAVVVEGDPDVSGVTDKELMNIASPSSSSSSTVAETQDMCNNLASDNSSQHDEAEDTTNEDTTDEDTTDVPEALPMPMRSLAITPINESDNQEPRLFEDTPEQANISSGLGIHEIMRLVRLREEPQHDADPHLVHEPEDLLLMAPSIVTFQIPGFSMSMAGGIVPFAEEQFVEDPDDVGLENLDIFMNP